MYVQKCQLKMGLQKIKFNHHVITQWKNKTLMIDCKEGYWKKNNFKEFFDFVAIDINYINSRVVETKYLKQFDIWDVLKFIVINFELGLNRIKDILDIITTSNHLVWPSNYDLYCSK